MEIFCSFIPRTTKTSHFIFAELKNLSKMEFENVEQKKNKKAMNELLRSFSTLAYRNAKKRKHATKNRFFAENWWALHLPRVYSRSIFVRFILSAFEIKFGTQHITKAFWKRKVILEQWQTSILFEHFAVNISYCLQMLTKEFIHYTVSSIQ